MSEPFVNSVNGLGTASLLRDLGIVQSCLERFDISSPESEAIDLLVQIKDLVDVTALLDGLATRERRNPSAQRKSLSASDLVHLHSVCSSAAAITQECAGIIGPLQSNLKRIAHERDVGYTTPESRLGDQAWYDETYQALKLRTEVLRVVFSSINLLHHKNDTDEDGHLSAEARSSASTLHYWIALVDPKLHITDKRSKIAVCSHFSNVDASLIEFPVAKRRGGRKGSNDICPSIRKLALFCSEIRQSLLHR